MPNKILSLKSQKINVIKDDGFKDLFISFKKIALNDVKKKLILYWGLIKWDACSNKYRGKEEEDARNSFEKASRRFMILHSPHISDITCKEKVNKCFMSISLENIFKNFLLEKKKKLIIFYMSCRGSSENIYFGPWAWSKET